MVTKKEFPDRIVYLNENGQLHREDGPAVEYSHGDKYWWLNGEYYTEEEFHQELIKLKLKRLVEL
jgi:hypothetical protein